MTCHRSHWTPSSPASLESSRAYQVSRNTDRRDLTKIFPIRLASEQEGRAIGSGWTCINEFPSVCPIQVKPFRLRWSLGEFGDGSYMRPCLKIWMMWTSFDGTCKGGLNERCLVLDQRVCDNRNHNPGQPTLVPSEFLPLNPVHTSSKCPSDPNQNDQWISNNTHRVGILNPQYPLSPELSGIKMVEQGSPESTKV